MSGYKGPLSEYAQYKRGRRAKVESRGSQQARVQAAVRTCRVSGCSSPPIGNGGAEGELCSVHLRAARERLAEERKRRRRM